MKKTDKKIENSVRKALTEVCELALEKVEGFKWITHFANYNCSPASISVVCVFDTDDHLKSAFDMQKDTFLRKIIKEKLGAASILIKDSRPHVSFDTEEACNSEHDGKWNERFK